MVEKSQHEKALEQLEELVNRVIEDEGPFAEYQAMKAKILSTYHQIKLQENNQTELKKQGEWIKILAGATVGMAVATFFVALFALSI